MYSHRWNCAVVLVAALALHAVVAAAQDTNTTAPPRTAWGDPDLQGVWDYASITPMQRPEQFGERAFLTDEEAAALEQGALERDRSAAAAPARRAEAGDNVGAYNLFWMDLGTKVVEDRRTSLIIDPPNGRYPALTEAGAAEAKTRRGFGAELPADSYEHLGWGDRCMAVHGLPIVPLPYNSVVQLFQTPDHVAIFSDSNRIWRIVPLDDRPHGSFRQWLGNARGRWDGDTLVVETTNFKYQLQQVGSGRNIRRLVERFTRESTGVIRYEFTVDDPVRWVSPWTAALSLRKIESEVYEVACHEGNYSLENILRRPQFSWTRIKGESDVEGGGGMVGSRRVKGAKQGLPSAYSASNRNMYARSNGCRTVQMQLLVIEKDVRTKNLKDARLVHSTQEKGLIDGDTPFAE